MKPQKRYVEIYLTVHLVQAEVTNVELKASKFFLVFLTHSVAFRL